MMVDRETSPPEYEDCGTSFSAMTSGGVRRWVEAVKVARATFGKEARAIWEGVATLVARMTERANILKDVGICAKVGVGCLCLWSSKRSKGVRRGCCGGKDEVRQGGLSAFIYTQIFPIHVQFTFVCPHNDSMTFDILYRFRVTFLKVFRKGCSLSCF
jgi:hypothetical protein